MTFIQEQQREAGNKLEEVRKCESFSNDVFDCLDTLTTQTITNTVNQILESGLLEEKVMEFTPGKEMGHNTLARAIKEKLNSLIE